MRRPLSRSAEVKKPIAISIEQIAADDERCARSRSEEAERHRREVEDSDGDPERNDQVREEDGRRQPGDAEIEAHRISLSKAPARSGEGIETAVARDSSGSIQAFHSSRPAARPDRRRRSSHPPRVSSRPVPRGARTRNRQRWSSNDLSRSNSSPSRPVALIRRNRFDSNRRFAPAAVGA